MDQNSDILRLQVEFFINRERLEIIEQITDLTVLFFFVCPGSNNGTCPIRFEFARKYSRYDFCKRLLKKWMIVDRKSLQNPTSD